MPGIILILMGLFVGALHGVAFAVFRTKELLPDRLFLLRGLLIPREEEPDMQHGWSMRSMASCML